MNDTELDRLATRAGAAVRAEATRIADSHRALADLMAAEAPTDGASEARGSAPTAVVTLDRPGRARPSRPWLPWVAALTAAAATVTVIAVADRSGDSIRSIDEPTTVTSQPTPATTEPAPPTVAPPIVRRGPFTPVEGSTEIIDDWLGAAQLSRTVLATFDAGELGADEGDWVLPIFRWAPLVVPAADSTGSEEVVLVADAFNGQWLRVNLIEEENEGKVTSRTQFGDDIVVGSPVVGPDGLVYALVGPSFNQLDPRRVVAYDPRTMREQASYDVSERIANRLELWNGELLLGNEVIRTFDVPLGTPTIGIESTTPDDTPFAADSTTRTVLTVSLSGVQHRFQLPWTWLIARRDVVALGDGSVLARVTRIEVDGESIEHGLVRLWADGTFATGLVTSGNRNVATDFDVQLTSRGLVQLEGVADGVTEVAEYALPDRPAPTGPAPTTQVPSTTQPSTDPLTGFSVPEFEPVTLDDVPRLLPTRMAPGATETTRQEWSDSTISIAPRFEQLWARADATGVVDAIVLVTAGTEWSLPGRGTPVDIANWTQAEFAPMAPGYESVDLVSPSGGARVWAVGLTRDEVAAIADGLRYAPDGETLMSPELAGWTPIVAQWTHSTAGRTIRQRDANGSTVVELLVDSGMGAVNSGVPTDLGMSLIDVSGAPALLVDTPGRPVVVWSPSTDVVVLMGAYATPDELVAIARSLTEVDQAAWEASATVHVGPGDGCDSMFC